MSDFAYNVILGGLARAAKPRWIGEGMVRRITANVYMTLDGRGEFPKYPGSDRESPEINALFRHLWFDRFDDVTTVVMGRRSFLGHQRTWSEKAVVPGEPAWLLDYRRYLDRVEKICLSHRLRSTDWEHARILRGDLARILAKLKREPGGNILVEGGPAVVRECLRRNLADDYWFFVMPVVYGKGPRYWTAMSGQCTLRLVETKPGEDGEVLLHYEVVR
ncbi:MAG TPA: dihydrofolate reductase family protein [Thermoplasmata archaeon]|nr:dihydrofolate reductase family protein [Thermoplasmata archaeon]